MVKSLGAGQARAGASFRIDALTHAYSGAGPVLNGICLDIHAGEFVSILGPSGCGKSTLLRFLADLETPTSGKIHFGGPLNRGFVFQEPRLLPWRTVLENVKLPLQLSREGGIPPAQHEAVATAALEKVGLAKSLRQFPDQLSGGMKMRVSVARALVLQPSLLLLDEPFSALDESIRHALQDDLRSLWQSLPMTVVFVTHSIAEAVYLADRAIVFSGAPGTILSDQPIALPHERNAALRLSPQFSAEMKKISELISFRGER